VIDNTEASTKMAKTSQKTDRRNNQTITCNPFFGGEKIALGPSFLADRLECRVTAKDRERGKSDCRSGGRRAPLMLVLRC